MYSAADLFFVFALWEVFQSPSTYAAGQLFCSAVFGQAIDPSLLPCRLPSKLYLCINNIFEHMMTLKKQCLSFALSDLPFLLSSIMIQYFAFISGHDSVFFTYDGGISLMR